MGWVHMENKVAGPRAVKKPDGRAPLKKEKLRVCWGV